MAASTGRRCLWLAVTGIYFHQVTMNRDSKRVTLRFEHLHLPPTDHQIRIDLGYLKFHKRAEHIQIRRLSGLATDDEGVDSMLVEVA